MIELNTKKNKNMIELVATKGPKRDLIIVNGPKDISSRLFTTNLYIRKNLTKEMLTTQIFKHSF